MGRHLVVDGGLLAGRDVARREEQDASADDTHEEVRDARVIDKRRGVASDVRVDSAVAVDVADADPAAAAQPRAGLAAGDALAGELGDLAPPLKRPRREASPAVDRRRTDDEIRLHRAVHLHSRCLARAIGAGCADRGAER